MRRFHLAVGCVLLAGCFHSPQTPDEFRKAASDSSFGRVETQEVDRPLRELGRILQAKADKCLSVAIEARSATTSSLRTFKPTVVVKRDRVELYVQEKIESRAIMLGGVPEDGGYIVVADGRALDKDRSRLTLYGLSMGDGKPVMKAIAGWASGEVSGCPDLTK